MDSLNNYWVINKKVYDLEPFLKKHPGGSYILKLCKGRDCTELFYSYHMGSQKSNKSFEALMKKYYIRDANPNEIQTDFNWENPEGYLDFKKRITEYFSGKSIKASWGAIVQYLLLFIVGMFSYYLWFSGYWLSLLLVPFIGIYFSGELLHSATHYSVVKSSRMNEILSYLGLYHCLPLSWYYQHVIGHHTHTNIQGMDPDLDHFRGLDMIKIGWRTNIKQKYHKYYEGWRKIIPVFACLASYGPLMLRSLKSLFTGYYMRRIKFRFTSQLEFFEFLLELGLFFLLPTFMIYKFGLIKGALFVIIPRILHGINFYLISQVSHIQSTAFEFLKNKSLNPNNEWIVHQILSSVDYNTTSWWHSFWSAGLNNQAIHHVCPTIHPCHFQQINKILVEFCKDRSIPYVCYDSYSKTLNKHLEYLGSVNDTN